MPWPNKYLVYFVPIVCSSCFGHSFLPNSKQSSKRREISKTLNR